jgi:hypothetical protein
MKTLYVLVNLFLAWRRAMKLRKFLKQMQWLNVLTIAGQVAAALAGVYPANATILTINAVLGAVLPSLGGISHKLDGTMVVPK